MKRVIILASKDSIISMQDKNFYTTEELIDQKIEIWQEHVLFLAYGGLGLPSQLSRGLSGFLLEKNKVQIE